MLALRMIVVEQPLAKMSRINHGKRTIDSRRKTGQHQHGCLLSFDSLDNTDVPGGNSYKLDLLGHGY